MHFVPHVLWNFNSNETKHHLHVILCRLTANWINFLHCVVIQIHRVFTFRRIIYLLPLLSPHRDLAHHYILSIKVYIKLKDHSWFNENCQNAIRPKEIAFNRWGSNKNPIIEILCNRSYLGTAPWPGWHYTFLTLIKHLRQVYRQLMGYNRRK